jgi:hypothetical protein
MSKKKTFCYFPKTNFCDTLFSTTKRRMRMSENITGECCFECGSSNLRSAVGFMYCYDCGATAGEEKVFPKRLAANTKTPDIDANLNRRPTPVGEEATS